jgi:LuxR family transcriptional regulator, maltose regulon positive regulatory protein
MGSGGDDRSLSRRRHLSSEGGIARVRRAPAQALGQVAAKLSRPQLLRSLVHRQRLINMLEAGARHTVTLVCAGAGWGKTVLVSSWADAQRRPVGWLTLDAEDNNPNVFWFHVVAALRETGAVPEDNPLAELGSLQAGDTELVERVRHGLAQMPGPVVLVLDDFHEIDDPQLLDSVAALLRYPPESFHLLLISRAEPALPLHRLRAAGQLTEIRAGELAFSPEESVELLAAHGLQLADDDLTTLLHRTEGWAAGLQLAVAYLAARGGPIRIGDFAGDMRAVEKYLADEVLANQPPDVRRFLLYTSVPEQVCGELADALTEEERGQWMLEELERVNAFIVRLGPKPQWFRYHPLLRDMLLHQLLLQQPPVLAELHLRAARWYAEREAILEALAHAAAARDWPFVGRLVAARAAPLIVSTKRAALARVLERIPTDELTATAELVVCDAVLLFHAGVLDAIPDRITLARKLLHDRPRGERLPVEATLRSLEVGLSRARGDMPQVIAQTTDLLAMLTEVRHGLTSILQYRAIALNNKGIGLLWTGQPDSAHRYLWSASTVARAAGIELVEAHALGHLALLEVLYGSLQEASQLAGTALDLAERRGFRSALQAAPAHLALALVELERNNVAEAERAVQQGLNAHRSDPEPAQAKVLLGTRARLWIAQGELENANLLLEQARLEATTGTRVPALDRWLLRAESEIDLKRGRPAQVLARYRGMADDELTAPDRVYLARAAFVTGDLRLAEVLLARPRPPTSDVVSAVEACILTAIVADVQGQHTRSSAALARAFAMAEQEGVGRPFVSMGGEQLYGLLVRERRLTAGGAAFIADVLVEMSAARTATEPPPPAGDLSERERDVLRYLPTMLTAGEIAVDLHVSVNTIKAHLRSIYRKLDASRRREAVVRARERGIL